MSDMSMEWNREHGRTQMEKSLLYTKAGCVGKAGTAGQKSYCLEPESSARIVNMEVPGKPLFRDKYQLFLPTCPLPHS